jgi:uncharacterized membrane protein YheB (UPF0754 family)
MKKIPLLLTSLIGAAGGYLLSNKKLRKDLQKSKNVQDGLQKVVTHLKKDGKTLGGELQSAVQHDNIQQPIADAKQFVANQFDEAKQALNETYESLVPKKKATTAKRTVTAKKKATTTTKRKVVAKKKTTKKTS